MALAVEGMIMAVAVKTTEAMTHVFNGCKSHAGVAQV